MKLNHKTDCKGNNFRYSGEGYNRVKICECGAEDHAPQWRNHFVNLTPHAIVLNDGRMFQPSGVVARVGATFSEFVMDIAHQVFDEIVGIPEDTPQGTMFIVSALVLQAAKEEVARGERERIGNLVAPATGHPDCVRNDKGHIVSVPGFVV